MRRRSATTCRAGTACLGVALLLSAAAAAGPAQTAAPQAENTVLDEVSKALNIPPPAAPANPAPAAVDVWRPLQNPFTGREIAQWLLDHGPRLAGIVLGMLLIYVLLKVAGRHLSAVLARSGRRGSAHERENRAVTLMSVFRNVVSIAVVAGGSLMVLDEIGIPIGPLMGGAAVVGLAVAFGAQNLVRDYFAGFMVLLEDQYGINDVVKINDTSGAVEQITLRVTVLRDLEGVAHFIPHGTITKVSNMTHGWSRAVLEVYVAYKEDTDRVMDVLLEVARELRADPAFAPLVTDDAEMLGVDNLGDSAVLIKMCIKTQALKRWVVKREMLRRIKHRFDELGIEIPFPHRTVLLRQAEKTVGPDGASGEPGG